MPSVLFVCTANRFRSPLAAAIFAHKLADLPDASSWLVESAGTWAIENLPAMRECLIEAKLRNLNISSHRSRIITQQLVDDFDSIIVMEIGHKEALLSEFPNAAGKVFLLTELGGGVPYSVPDPYISNEAPDYVAQEIQNLIDNSFTLIYKQLKDA